ncbi:uncharacterized protein LOC144914420 [Branchiostoma floridae x Branchiostoma belcheri]
MTYNGKCIQGLGWALVVMGSLNIILGIVADVLFGVMGAFALFHYISTPIWCGVLILISGVMGIYSGKNTASRNQMVIFLVGGMVAIFFSITLLLLGIIGALVDGNICDQEHHSYHNPCSAPAIALHTVNAALALAEVVIAFIGSVMACTGLAQPTERYDRGPNMSPGQAAFVIGHGASVAPGAEGKPYPQQQVFAAQQPYANQGYYGTMAPPPYTPQTNSGAVPGNASAETKPEPPV